MLGRVVVIVVVAAASLWFVEAPSASAAADVTQARYMTPSQFLQSLKQVSLTLHGGSDVLDEYLPVEKAQDMIQNALANRGIVVRPNSPVALEVTLSHERRSTKNLDEPVVRHDYFLTLQFFVRGAVWRNGKFHALPVAPASVWWATYVLEPNELQRLLLNEETGKWLRQQFAQGVVDSLNTIDASSMVDTTPFPPHSWSDREKTQGNADFARVMRTDTPMDSSLILELDVEPKLDLTAEFKESECAGGPTFRELWGHEFRQLKWTRQMAQPPLTVEHEFHCRIQKDPRAVAVFHVIHHISLKEANAVFELNGELFRKPVTLQSSEVMTFVNAQDADEEWFAGLSRRAIFREFDSGLRHGAHERPSLPGAQLSDARRVLGVPTGRMILGEDVRFEHGGWRYANGTQVPDSLLDKATGGPPLRPKSQRPVTQAPVSTYVTDITRTLGAIKSCQLYASASRDNLLWSVLSPALEIDDSGVIVSRYVLSTRSEQGYAQGAAIANLSLIAAQIQDRGGCKILSIPCKNGQCVRFEDNANPSLSVFVETAGQANTILSALKALAPLYPDGAGALRK
ncbi:MAG TPA: hypothetical protein VLL06_08765 [Nitrospiraceae bacterium]|nr:hypothetical protein [Nitrospiraceae bacterium]